MSSESKAATPEFTNMTWLENSKKHCDFPVSHVIFFERWTYFFAYFERWGGSVGIGEVGHLGRETSETSAWRSTSNTKDQVVDRTKKSNRHKYCSK